MNMSRLNLLLLLSAPALLAQSGATANDWLLPNLALRLSVDVANPGQTPVHALATVPVAKARAVAPEFPGRLAIAFLINPDGARTPATAIASQSDDLDGDGTPDQFEFPVSLAPGERRRVDIYYSTTLTDTIVWPKRVQAKHSYGYNRQVAAIESELIGYRTYGGFFLDMMGRSEGSLGLNNDTAAYVPIWSDLGTGRDVLHIGNSLGLGGIFLRRSDKLYQPPMNIPDYAHKPSPEMSPHYRVIAQGPLRAIFEAVLSDWNIDGDVVRLRAQYSIDANEPFVRCRFEAAPVQVAASHEYAVGVGIRDLPVESLSPGTGRIVLTGKQNERDGVIGLGLFFDPRHFAAPSQVKTRDESLNRAVIVNDRLIPGSAVRVQYTLCGAWSGSGIQDPGGYLAGLSEAITATVTVDGLRFARTPRPDRVDAEAQ